jgi:hypothetical protein
VHARQALALVLGRRGRPRLVVGHHQLAVGVELEPVDDASQADAVDLGLDPQLEPDGPHGRGVLEAEVVADQIGRLGVEPGRGLVVEPEGDELGVVAEGVRCVVEAGERGLGRALGGNQAVEGLERGVNKGAAGGGDRGRLGQPVDGGEPEREGTVGERRHLGRAERARHREGHGCESTRGV